MEPNHGVGPLPSAPPKSLGHHGLGQGLVAHEGELSRRPTKGAQIPPPAGQLGDLEGEKHKNFQPSRMLDGTTPQLNQGGGASVGNCGSSAPG